MKIDIIINRIKNYNPTLIQASPHTAAVMIFLMQDGTPNLHLILTKRADGLTSYSGDYCFPGGVQDHSDLDLKHTAQREVQEELGLAIETYQTIGQLDDFEDRYGNTVRPFVAIITKELFEKNLKNSSEEVAGIFYFPLADLEKIKTDADLEKITRRHPTYKYQENEIIVWGLTASLIVHFGNIINQTNLPVTKYTRIKTE